MRQQLAQYIGSLLEVLLPLVPLLSIEHFLLLADL